MKKEGVLVNYIIENKKTFLTILIVFFVGMILGVIFINHAQSSQVVEINNYVNELINNIKTSEHINKTDILFQSIKQNVLIILIIWLLGCTIIGSFFIYLVIIYRGFSLGYTIAAVVACLDVKSAIIFILSALLIQNIIFLPTIFILSESGIKLYNVISKNYTNMKKEMARYSAIMLISVVLAIISSLIEVYISTNLLILFKEFL